MRVYIGCIRGDIEGFQEVRDRYINIHVDLVLACKAPAISLVRHEVAMQEQNGVAATQLQLGAQPNLSEKNASRHVSRLAHTFKITLSIPVSEHIHTEQGTTTRLPYLKPANVLGKLLMDHPYMLLGGFRPGADSETLLTTFWENYKLEQPSHKVYASPSRRLKRTIPIYLHGDGGRTQKKQPLEVLSMEPVLGLNTSQGAEETCRCSVPVAFGSNNLENPIAQKLNSKNNSFLTKFLIFAFPSKKYKRQPNLLISLHEAASKNLAEVCKHGLMAKGERFYAAILGYKADFEYHAKFGSLERSYMHAGRTQQLGVCHECWAGTPDIPFEDPSTRALWTDTVCASFPWKETPPFKHIPFEAWESLPSRAPQFYRRDPFHVFRLGTLTAYC